MTFNIKTTKRPTGDLSQSLADFATLKSREEAEALGREMVRYAAQFADERTTRGELGAGTTRGSFRRVNTTHLVDSFKYEIVQTGSSFNAVLTTKPGVNAKKVAALEYGTRKKDYPILPVNAKKLSWQSNYRIASAAAGTRRNRQRTRRNTRGARWVAYDMVTHPGLDGFGFMADAVDAAIRSRGLL